MVFAPTEETPAAPREVSLTFCCRHVMSGEAGKVGGNLPEPWKPFSGSTLPSRIRPTPAGVADFVFHGEETPAVPVPNASLPTVPCATAPRCATLELPHVSTGVSSPLPPLSGDSWSFAVPCEYERVGGWRENEW